MKKIIKILIVLITIFMMSAGFIIKSIAISPGKYNASYINNQLNKVKKARDNAKSQNKEDYDKLNKLYQIWLMYSTDTANMQDIEISANDVKKMSDTGADDNLINKYSKEDNLNNNAQEDENNSQTSSSNSESTSSSNPESTSNIGSSRVISNDKGVFLRYNNQEMENITKQISNQIKKLDSEQKDHSELDKIAEKWENEWNKNKHAYGEVPTKLITDTKDAFKKSGAEFNENANANISSTDEDDAEDENDGLGTPGPLKLLTTALDGVVGILFLLPKTIFLISLYTVGQVINLAAGGEFSIESIIFNQAVDHPVEIISIDFFDSNGDSKGNTKALIQQNIATWYVAIRNIAITILVIVAMYIAIRMLLATTSEKKAQYKEILIYWVQSLALIFVLHYIMIGIIAINDALVKSLYKAGEEVITGKNNNIMETLFSNAFSAIKITTSLANTFAYMVLCFVTIMFFISYLKRMMTIAFLITIAPLVTITYSIDKIGDGKSQALNAWLKEFSYTILIQPFHCITYLALGSIGTQLLERNDNFGDIFIGLYFLSFILQSENIVRGIFGIQPSTMKNVIGEMSLVAAVAGKFSGAGKSGIQYTGDSKANRFIGGAERSGGQKRTPNTNTQSTSSANNQSSQGANTTTTGQANWYDHYNVDDARREELNNKPNRTASENNELANINNKAMRNMRRRRTIRRAANGYVGLSMGIAGAMAKMALAVASGDGKAMIAEGFSAKDSIKNNMDKAVERATRGDMIDAYKLARKVSPDKDDKYFKDLAKGKISAANDQEQEFVDSLSKHQNIMDKHGKIDDKHLDDQTDTLLDNINRGDLDQHNALYRAGRWIGRRKSN